MLYPPVNIRSIPFLDEQGMALLFLSERKIYYEYHNSSNSFFMPSKKFSDKPHLLGTLFFSILHYLFFLYTYKNTLCGQKKSTYYIINLYIIFIISFAW